MNLVIYDKIENATPSVIKPYYKKLYTSEVSYRKYYTYLKRYDSNNKTYTFYLLLSDKFIDGYEFKSVIKDMRTVNRFKFDLRMIWKQANLDKYTTNHYISLVHSDHDDDGDIYRLDI